MNVARVFIVFLIVSFLTIFTTSCHMKNNPFASAKCSINSNSKYEHKVNLETAKFLIGQHILKSKPNINPDISFTLEEISCDGLYEKMGIQVFKIPCDSDFNPCESYIINNGKVSYLCTGFGGFGLQSLCVADLDANGSYELVYTYSWGSGIHRSLIGICYFDQDTLIQSDAPVAITNSYDFYVKKCDDHNVKIEICEVSQDSGYYPVALFGNVKIANTQGGFHCIIEENQGFPETFRKQLWYSNNSDTQPIQ